MFFSFSKEVDPIQIVLCQIYVFCHQLTQNTKTDFLRFYEDLRKLFWNSNHKFCKFWNLYKSDEISGHILGQFVTKYVDLAKNNL